MKFDINILFIVASASEFITTYQLQIEVNSKQQTVSFHEVPVISVLFA